MKIPIGLKIKCLEAKSTMNSREIFNQVFSPVHPTMCYETFRRRLQQWKNLKLADTETLAKGTYEGFTAHNATVQVDSEGNITQAWIKQAVDDNQYEQILDAIKDNIRSVKINRADEISAVMLEIPLFDMHFGVATFKDYKKILFRILNII